ncbi:MAG: hypothetical protein G8345_08030 [Magnetococcales bacterium]|nr:hypothetical protein [Magnetococcales bacterium]NGZ26823.1 hypothetical protein [Magnetococcales bacterium]
MKRLSFWVVFLLALVVMPLVPLRGDAAEAKMRTIAIMDFDNNTVADMATITSMDYLTRALPEMLLARLSGITGVKMVERVHLRQALEELKLGSSDLADDDSKLKLGKLTGAQQMAFGSFMALGPTCRIDVRLVDVSTSQILLSEAEQGSVNDIPALAEKLAKKIAAKISKSSPKAVQGSQKDLKVWQKYDEGVKLMDKKKFEDSIKIFEGILKTNPDFKPAARQIELAVEKMSRM